MNTIDAAGGPEVDNQELALKLVTHGQTCVVPSIQPGQVAAVRSRRCQLSITLLTASQFLSITAAATHACHLLCCFAKISRIFGGRSLVGTISTCRTFVTFNYKFFLLTFCFCLLFWQGEKPSIFLVSPLRLIHDSLCLFHCVVIDRVFVPVNASFETFELGSQLPIRPLHIQRNVELLFTKIRDGFQPKSLIF